MTTTTNTTLGGLTALPATLGSALVAWAQTAQVGATSQPAGYAGALAVAIQANGGQPVTKGQVAGMFYALGGVAPGRSNDNGYAARRNIPLWQSLHFGANRHLTGTLSRHLQEGTSKNGQATFVPTGKLAEVVKANRVSPAELRKLAMTATEGYVSRYGTAGQTPRRGGTPTYAVLAVKPPAPSKAIAAKPVKEVTAK